MNTAPGVSWRYLNYPNRAVIRRLGRGQISIILSLYRQRHGKSVRLRPNHSDILHGNSPRQSDSNDRAATSRFFAYQAELFYHIYIGKSRHFFFIVTIPACRTFSDFLANFCEKCTKRGCLDWFPTCDERKFNFSSFPNERHSCARYYTT